jgi:hypothetical protein
MASSVGTPAQAAGPQEIASAADIQRMSTGLHGGGEQAASDESTPRLAIVGTGADGGLIERSIGSLLRVVREQLQLDVVFVGEFVNGHRVFRHVSSRPDAMKIAPGQGHPLDATLCKLVAEGRVPPLTRDLARTCREHGLPNFGCEGIAHIGVPVRFGDGSLYGVLCGFTRGPSTHLDERDVARLEMAAEATARLLAQAEGRDMAREAERY